MARAVLVLASLWIGIAAADAPPAQQSKKALVIRGRVVDDRGEPVSRFLIETVRPSDRSPRDSRRTNAQRRLAATAFNGDGSFALKSLADGEWEVAVLGAGDTHSPPQLVTLPWSGGDLELVLPRAGRITGVVVDDSAAPVPQAAIYAIYPGENPHTGMGRHDGAEPRALAEANGRFELEKLQPGTVLLAITDEAHADSEWTSVVVEPAGATDVVLRVTVGARVVGSIDPSLGEVFGREVELFSFNGSLGWRTTYSDPAGRFTIENVIPQPYVIELRPPGYSEGTVAPGAESIRRRIDVREKQTVAVVFEKSRTSIPVSGRVTIGGVPTPFIEVRSFPLESQDDLNRTAITDQDGRYALVLNAAGKWRFTCSKSWGSDASEERTVPEPTSPEPVPLAFDFDLPGGAISGTLRSSDGLPLGFIQITLVRDPTDGEDAEATFWSRYSRTHVLKDGSFEFALLRPGTYVLRAPDGGWRDSPPPLAPFGGVVVSGLRVAGAPLDPLLLQLKPAGRVVGRVVDGTGKPVDCARIQVFDANGVAVRADWASASDAAGSFEIPSLAPGTYTVAARDGSRTARSAPIMIEVGKTGSVRIELR